MWIVLDPVEDVAMSKKKFATEVEALEWLDVAKIDERDVARLAILQRCVIAPHDPDRD